MPLVFNQVRNCRLAWKTVIEKLQAEKKKICSPAGLQVTMMIPERQSTLDWNKRSFHPIFSATFFLHSKLIKPETQIHI
jgi:hypothetical protein